VPHIPGVKQAAAHLASTAKEVVMPNIVNMSWVFAVVFISILAMIVAFALLWVADHDPMHRHK
jgi:hypothetical protein